MVISPRMQISWNGLGSFSIIGKPMQGDVTVVIDPYTEKAGQKFPKNITASIVVSSGATSNANGAKHVSGEEGVPPFLIEHAGEYEAKGVFVKGIRVQKQDKTEHTIYKITAEDMTVGCLGSLDRVLTDAEIEKLGSIDILILPIGGDTMLDTKQAVEVVQQVEPRVVIPAYGTSSIEAFCKELASPVEKQSKYKVVAGKLPQDEILIVDLT
ncbi:MAG: MBL fold metallo-hydrolase [bacterium]|nr:MBL fold metallo-hydrolase [bacterium]